MLILVLGDTTDCDVEYIVRYAVDLGDDRRVKIFPFDANTPCNTQMEKMIYNHRHMATAGEIDFDDMIITSENVKWVAPYIRSNAARMIFTDFKSFEATFKPFSSDGFELLPVGSVVKAASVLINRTAIVIYDRFGKRIFCLE